MNFSELTQSNQEVEQSNEHREDSHRNATKKDSGTPPRRSTRKIKPVLAPDGETYQNESSDKNNQSENKSSTFQDINSSNSKVIIIIIFSTFPKLYFSFLA